MTYRLEGDHRDIEVMCYLKRLETTANFRADAGGSQVFRRTDTERTAGDCSGSAKAWQFQQWK